MRLIIFLSEAMVPLMILYIVGSGLLSGRPMLGDFIDGAKDGMEAVAGVLPILVGLMVSVGVLRASGSLGLPGKVLTASAALIHPPPQIIPVILVRLVSNSAATGLILDTFKEFGMDSSTSLIVSILTGSTETVLYYMSVYSGSVRVRKTRYTLAGGLITIAAGVAVSVILAGAVSG